MAFLPRPAGAFRAAFRNTPRAASPTPGERASGLARRTCRRPRISATALIGRCRHSSCSTI